jgi:hypothetical protein
MSSSNTSSMGSPTMIGDGSFGCVFSPSLKCKNKRNINYKNKISKLLDKTEAEIELEGYNKISKIDKENKYHVGEIIMCDYDENGYDAAQFCEDQLIDSSHLSLLIMKNGGENLDTFIKKMAKLNVNNETIRIIESFLIDLHNVFMGLKKMSDNDIVHHDLKSQNLVYNNNKIKFIDFGRMTTKTLIKESSKNNSNELAVYHWSLPLESKFYDNIAFQEFSKSTNIEKEDYIKKIDQYIKKKNNNKQFSVAISNLIKATDMATEDHERLINEFYETLMNYYTTDTDYDTFLNTSIDSIDIYGTGIACISFYNLNNKFITNELKRDLYDLFYQMIRPDFYKRIKIDDLINQYEHILEKHNILSKYNKRFVHHELVENTSHKSSTHSSKHSSHKSSTHSSKHSPHKSSIHSSKHSSHKSPKYRNTPLKRNSTLVLSNSPLRSPTRSHIVPKQTNKNAIGPNGTLVLSNSYSPHSSHKSSTHSSKHSPHSSYKSSTHTSKHSSHKSPELLNPPPRILPHTAPIRVIKKINKKTSNTIKKCKDDQEFIKETGKCYKKCNANQTRNDKTKRCNKIQQTKKKQNNSSFRLSRPPIRPPSRSPFRLSRPPIRPPSRSPIRPNKNTVKKCKDDQKFIEKIGKCYKKCNANQTRNDKTNRCNKNK